jgi:hypothetical protein
MQHNSMQPHITHLCVERIERNSWELLAHPPYILDLAPSDQYVFGFVNDQMRGQQYVTIDVVQDAVCYCL